MCGVHVQMTAPEKNPALFFFRFSSTAPFLFRSATNFTFYSSCSCLFKSSSEQKKKQIGRTKIHNVLLSRNKRHHCSALFPLPFWNAFQTFLYTQAAIAKAADLLSSKGTMAHCHCCMQQQLSYCTCMACL